MQWITLIIGGTILLVQSEARRFPLQRPLPQEEAQEEETVNYYAAEPQEDEGQVVLVSSADRYNGLYGQQQVSARKAQDNYIHRNSPKEHLSLRTKEAPRQPPVQTIRNYNKVNDDGSFTFGYEAADGSFKEETRGKCCSISELILMSPENSLNSTLFEFFDIFFIVDSSTVNSTCPTSRLKAFN